MAAFCAALAAATTVLAQRVDEVPDIGLDELVNAEVVTASRRAQSLHQVAAAVFVITREDIARSGARSLADALAMAPGMEVARIGNNRWAVSARGYNGRFANKLQVLRDGRSLYSPPFASVAWEAEDTLLEDIERIEVIRGPNAAVWGANAVNGTINIITRKARDTQGGLVAVTAGSADRHQLSARYGTMLGDTGHLRLYGKSVDRRAGFRPDGSRAHDWGETGMAGFRADWLLAAGNRLSFNGEIYRDRNADIYDVPAPLSPNYVDPVASTTKLSGGHLQGRYESLHDDGSEIVLQSYFTRRLHDDERVMREERETLDVDIQYRFAPRGDHDLMLGANYRKTTDVIDTPAGSFLSFARRSRSSRLGGIFLNDEITLVPDRFRVTIGARLEHNTASGSDLQPTLRFLWTPNAQQAVWGAVSRAARTPSRAELDISMPLSVNPPTPATGGLPVFLTMNSNTSDTQKSETLNAVELGYRQRFSPDLSVDAAFFAHHDHDTLSVLPGTATPQAGYLLLPLTNVKGGRARLHGIELSAFVQADRRWRLKPAFTWLHGTARGLGDHYSEGMARSDMNKMPRRQFSLRSQHDLEAGGQLDFWLKHKSRTRFEATQVPLDIAAYTDLDIRYAWHPSRDTQVSLVGQNLLHRRRIEFVADQLPSTRVEIGRSVHVRAEYRF